MILTLVVCLGEKVKCWYRSVWENKRTNTLAKPEGQMRKKGERLKPNMCLRCQQGTCLYPIERRWNFSFKAKQQY